MERPRKGLRAPLALIAVVGLLVTACSGTAATASPTIAPTSPPTAAPTSPPTAAPTPSATASAAPSTSASASASPSAALSASASTAPSASASASASAGTGGPSISFDPGTAGGTMTVAYVGPCCNGVDFPQPLTATGDYMWLNKIYEHLTTYSVDPTTVSTNPYSGGYGPMVPELAASWETSTDGLTWTFHLQPNVKWSDGMPFTSADVAFSLALCLNPKAGGCTWSGNINDIVGADALKAGTATTLSGVGTPDPQTVTIQTTHPDAAIADAMSNIWMLQQASVSKLSLAASTGLNKDPYWSTPGEAIGTGPFMLTQYQQGQFMELSANPNYWRGKPLLGKIVRKEFTDPSTALIAFDAGQLDYTYLTADEEKREEGNANAVVLPGPSQVDNLVVFNPLANPAFANPLFKQAMTVAINRDAIIQNLYGGGGTVQSCFFGNPAYGTSADPLAYSVDKAKQLIQQAGVDMTKLPTFTFDTYYNDPLSLSVMQAIQADWAAVGFNVKIDQMDPAAWTKQYYNDGKSQISFIGAQNGPDGNIASTYFLSTAAWPNGSNGWKGYSFSDPKVDTLIKQGASSFDPAARQATYQQLCAQLVTDMPENVMWQTTRYWIVNKRIGNFVSTPAAGTGSYYDASEKWYIKP
jgi:peptide/nickel transport system substrate-binding protein